MWISTLGVRNYEKICASDTGKQVAGCVMILRSVQPIAYPPAKLYVGELTDTEIRDRLNNYKFFVSMSPGARRSYLESVAVSNDDLYMNDVPGLYVKFLSIDFCSVSGKKRTPFLDDATMDRLMLGNPTDSEGFWSLRYVYELFPRRVGSKAKHTTLVFRPNNWILMEREVDTVDYTGLCCYLPTGEALVTSIHAGGAYITHPYESFAVITNAEVVPDYDVRALASQYLQTDLTPIFTRFQPYPPSLLKSLLQKIIRFRPSTVGGLSSNVVLIATFVALYTHPGAFVPDLKKFVTGKESATKRLAVSIIEDSTIASINTLQSLFAAALLTRDKKDWSVRPEVMIVWFSAALEALASTNTYIYDTKASHIEPSCQMLYYLLSTIVSFQTDIAMVSSITGIQTTTITSSVEMPFAHAVDHHCYPDVAWFLPELGVSNYTELFRLLWTEVSSINARKVGNHSEDVYVKCTAAQQLFLESKEVTPIFRNVVAGEYHFSIRLEDSYLAACVGISEFKNSYAVITPTDITQINAARRPARGCKECTLCEEDYNAAVVDLQAKLFRGIAVKDSLIDIIYLRDGVYYVSKNGIITAWTTYQNIEFSLPLHIAIENRNILETAIRTCGCGITENADSMLELLLQNTPLPVLHRLLLYTEGNVHHVVPYKISRDGTGVDYKVSILDTDVYWFLAELSVLYPAALQHSKNSGYDIQHPQLFRKLINMIQARTARNATVGTWLSLQPESRILYDHQIAAISRLDVSKGLRNIIWMAAGMGKTTIITSHIARCIQQGLMPLYCIYTLPVSAIAAVSLDFTRCGIPWVLADSNNAPQPNCVSFIYHDSLRTTIDSLRPLLSSSLVIIDEFHKTLNPTQRTSAALECAILSHSFIAMTGTLYKDDKVDNLLIWLQLLYTFEVTAKNYWVAVAGLISIRCDTTVKVERLVVEEPLNIEELQRYKQVTPKSLGGMATSLNFVKAKEISYEAITRRLVQEVLTYLQMQLGVFVVARHAAHAEEISSLLERVGVHKIAQITSKTSMSLTPAMGDPFAPGSTLPYVTITTPTHCEGYDMTLYRVMVSGVYFSNEATREQLERRINRLSQTALVVRIVLIHAGLISYIAEKYEGVRNIAAKLKGFARDMGVVIHE
jgi:superfamily II DNA or RNA helicase